MTRSFFPFAVTLLSLILSPHQARADQLWAGAAKIDITNRGVPLVNDPLYAKALVIKNKQTTIAIVTVDAVAIEEIGSITSAYLPAVRKQIEADCGIEPKNILVNASHCHGIVCADVTERTIQVIKEAWGKMVPVEIGVGAGHEDRIMENRRLKLKDGTELDVRHAYAMPPDEQVAEVGPVDPQIGILRLNSKNGETLAVVYNFACHPIQGVPNGGNTADMTGFASQVIEDNLSDGTVALFLQGCAGDINPIRYKAVNAPRDAEPLGNLLGLSTLKALRKIQTAETGELKFINETIELPRADLADRIEQLETEQRKLLGSLRGTSLNLKTFVPLVVKYKLSEEFPTYYSHSYLNDQQLGRDTLTHLDAENRRNMEQYVQNIYTMEALTRLQTNLTLLKKHQAQNIAAGKRTIDVEVTGLKLGEFVLVTFPGELTVPIGLKIKQTSPLKNTFVAGYTNGYIYYSPTAEQLKNVGRAQEDSDCILAPEWEAIFEAKVSEILKRL